MGFNKLLPLVGQFLFVGVFYELVHHIPSHRPVMCGSLFIYVHLDKICCTF